MTGDADRQPVEGAVTLSDLAAGMDETEAEIGDEDSEQVEGDGSDAEADDDVEEAEGEDDAEDEPQEEPTVTLKHDGKDVTLPQSEVVKLAQQGFDYTQKTMAVAEERKAVEAEKSQVIQARTQAQEHVQETINRLEAYSNYMQQQVGSPPHVSLASTDVGAYIAQKEQYEFRKGQLQEARAAVQSLQDEQAQKRQAWIAEKVETTERVLKDTLPGWNDALLDELADYAGKLGLTPQSAEAAILEPGFWQLAQKAKAYDELLAEKAKLKPKSELPKVQKPSAANHPSRGQTKRVDAEKRYQAKPSLNTLADLIE